MAKLYNYDVMFDDTSIMITFFLLPPEPEEMKAGSMIFTAKFCGVLVSLM